MTASFNMKFEKSLISKARKVGQINARGNGGCLI